MQKSKCKIKVSRFHRGYSLLLAVLLTSTIIVSAVALARVVVLNLRQVRDMDRSISAYSAASSGIERGLFLIKKGGEDLIAHPKTEDIGDATVTVTAQQSGDASFKIAENDFVVLDLPAGHNLTGMQISSGNDNCQAAWLEISLAVWDESNFEQISRHLYPLSDFIEPVFFDLLPNTITQVRLKALYCDISKVTVNGISVDGIKPLPARLTIKAVGQYRDAVQALQAAVLERSPLNGLFDFVVFSECPLLKGDPAACE
ncbi:MAG: hypothetical protein Q8M83_04680 [bacterium]|nr:hypothetical protein [bacterium]